MKGLELSRQFYEGWGKPMIMEQFSEYIPFIAAGMAGEGSDCFGYDDEISRDHDFEAGFCLWIPDRLERELEFKLSRAYGKLPEEFMGVKRAPASFGAGNRRGVILTGNFYRRFTGRPGLPESLMEWLYTPEYSLACAVNGAVFQEADEEFCRVRKELQKGYPEDVRRKKMAARVIFMAQAGQYNLGRCLKRGERGAAALCLTEFVQNALSLLFLLNGKYMPYYKWSFRAARELSAEMEQAGRLTEKLTFLVTEGLCSDEAEKRARVTVEEICRELLDELRAQGLTDGPWDYLEPHAYEIMERIQDGEIRNLHVMEG